MTGYDMHRGDNPAYGLTEEYATDLFTDEAMKIIQRHEPPRPLYLQISHLAVHAPLESPDDYRRNHEDEQFKHIREVNRRKYASMYNHVYLKTHGFCCAWHYNPCDSIDFTIDLKWPGAVVEFWSSVRKCWMKRRGLQILSSKSLPSVFILGMVWRLDESVGRIVHALGDRGMLKDSLILFLTDNGAAPIGRFRNWGSNYPLRGVRISMHRSYRMT